MDKFEMNILNTQEYLPLVWYQYIDITLAVTLNLVTSDVVVLYPGIHHEAVLKALKDALDNRENKSIITDLKLKVLLEWLVLYCKPIISNSMG